MELLKSNPVIDESYIPVFGMNYLDYFNRALKFAQTNYHEHLVKISRLHQKSVTAANFFEEYVGALLISNEEIFRNPNYFNGLTKSLEPYHKSFWDLNVFPKEEDIQKSLSKFNFDEKQLDSIHRTAQIMNQGIKLFGWDRYRNNFLDSPSKLGVLPGLRPVTAKLLHRNIGGAYCPDDIQNLYELAKSFGFENAEVMCSIIQKNFPMSYRTIGTVLWYSTITFKVP